MCRSGPWARLTVPWDRPALDCFKLMHDRGLSAVGVVDQARASFHNKHSTDLESLFSLLRVRMNMHPEG